MKKNKANINYQDHPHQEGAQNNTAPEGQPNAHNNTRSISEMNQDSPEQLAGRNKEANKGTERDEQKDNRGGVR